MLIQKKFIPREYTVEFLGIFYDFKLEFTKENTHLQLHTFELQTTILGIETSDYEHT